MGIAGHSNGKTVVETALEAASGEDNLIVDDGPGIAFALDFLLQRNSRTVLSARGGGAQIDKGRAPGVGASVSGPFSIERLVASIDALPGPVAQPGGT
jgi:hypothetical protein